MHFEKHTYHLKILEQYIDFLGHVHHANYLILFEQARWDWISQKGYGVQQMQETNIGPVILQVDIKYRRELKARQDVIIESQVSVHQKLITTIHQEMKSEPDKVHATVDIKFGCFDLVQRKLVNPPQVWLNAIGIRDGSHVDR